MKINSKSKYYIFTFLLVKISHCRYSVFVSCLSCLLHDGGLLSPVQSYLDLRNYNGMEYSQFEDYPQLSTAL